LKESYFVIDKKLNLIRFFKGYVRNYRSLNIYQQTNSSMFTKREEDYFSIL